MDEILHTPREESSAIRPPLAQLRTGLTSLTIVYFQAVSPGKLSFYSIGSGSVFVIDIIAVKP